MAELEIVERADDMSAGPAEGLAALLEVSTPGADLGLPIGWHWCYLMDRPRQSDLGPDGHPAMGTIPRPPGSGRRRMFAGGLITTLKPLLLGTPAVRRASVAAVTEKVGSTGPFTVVSLLHEIEQNETVVLQERQDLVYRPDAPLDLSAHLGHGTSPKNRAEGDWEVPVSNTLLFRYSALTYNSHRIHYDAEYSRDVEGYPALVVHGPLQILAMAEHVRRRFSDAEWTAAKFEYRLVSPLLIGQGMVVRSTETSDGFVSSVHADDGRVTARGTYTLS
jgi:3-methylfumaryl-CoA hydratase